MKEQLARLYRNIRWGRGRWHCDDILRAGNYPACVLAFLAHARGPEDVRYNKPAPPLFADYCGLRVRVIRAYGSGRVGISTNLLSNIGNINQFVFLPELSSFLDTPVSRNCMYYRGQACIDGWPIDTYQGKMRRSLAEHRAGQITGKSAEALIVDDPLNREAPDAKNGGRTMKKW